MMKSQVNLNSFAFLKLGQQGTKTLLSQNWYGVFLGVVMILWKKRWPEAIHVLLTL